MDTITTADVMAVLLPIWTAKAETARRVRQRIGTIMKWAVAQGYRDDNPAGDAIAAALPKVGDTRRHFRTVHHNEAGKAIRAVRGIAGVARRAAGVRIPCADGRAFRRSPGRCMVRDRHGRGDMDDPRRAN